MSEEDVKKERKPRELKGIALETDIMKKIAHQIDRLPPGSDAGERILAYMEKALAEKKLGAVKGLDKDGQAGFEFGQ